jgi:hypothetical protein
MAGMPRVTIRPEQADQIVPAQSARRGGGKEREKSNALPLCGAPGDGTLFALDVLRLPAETAGEPSPPEIRCRARDRWTRDLVEQCG